jgi:predicted ribosomally synthesized peptide with SipW-like signal peptide
MTNAKATKRALLMSVVSLIICFTMLLGTTYAWFTDSVTSAGNIIKSGTLDVEMYWADGTKAVPADGPADWKNAASGAIFNNDKWEPGYAEVRHIKIENKGTLALKYALSIDANGEVSKLADVIDVYYADPAEQVADRAALAAQTPMSNLTKALAGMATTANGTLKAGESVTITIALKMQETAGNEYQYLSIGSDFAIKLLATQLDYEKDSFDDQYDKDAEYADVEKTVIDTTTTEAIEMTAGDATITMPAGMEAGAYEFAVSNVTKTTTDDDKTVLAFDLNLTKDGAKVTDDGTVYTVSWNVGKGYKITKVTHNGEDITPFNYNSITGILTFNVTHFSPFSIEYYDEVVVDTADKLVEALEKGWNVRLANDIKIDPANMSNAYGATGINIKKGQTLDGGGFTLDIKGAGGTWDSGINTTGGVIKNIKVTGAFRGIFVNHNSDHSETVVLENVTTDGTTYTISCDQGMNQNLVAVNCTFNGWTSYATTIGTATFDGCTFGEGSGYAYMRPYAPTTYKNCSFEAGFRVDPRAAVTFEKCTLDGVLITAENLATLVTSNIGNATVK